MSISHIAVVHWPEEAAVIAYLRSQGRPRLLLIDADTEAPETSDWDEDWIRLPARSGDLQARASALQARSAQRNPTPVVKGDGRLLFEGRWVALSRIEEGMTQALARHFGEVVDLDCLAASAGRDPLTATAVRVHLTRLRKRIGPIGLVVRTVRGRGYVLDRAAPGDEKRRTSPYGISGNR